MNLTNRSARESAKPGSAGRPRRAARRGFSIIELVGVLAIVAILAAAMVPAILRQTDQAALTKEISDLNVMASALQSHILRTKNIPDQTSWAAAITDDTAMPIYNITNTPRRYGRVFLIDPALQLNGAGLPFTQTAAGVTNRPSPARVMILASLTRPLPVASGVPSSSDFNAIWNTPRGVKPGTSAFTSWAGNGKDLVIQRINLEPLFHRLILNDDMSGVVGRYAIDSNSPVALPATTTDAYYLDGTVLGLYNTNATPVLLSRVFLKTDSSPILTSSNWLNSLQVAGSAGSGGGGGGGGGSYPGAAQIGAIADQFIKAPKAPGAQWGASPSIVASQIYSYMFGYSAWATQSPCFANQGSTFFGITSQWLFLNSLLWFGQSGNLIGH